eukprot:390744-Hanusia_phi.AAC.1
MPGDQECSWSGEESGEEGIRKESRQEGGGGCWSSEMEELFREALEHVVRPQAPGFSLSTRAHVRPGLK